MKTQLKPMFSKNKTVIKILIKIHKKKFIEKNNVKK